MAASITWPSTLPLPLQSGSSETPPKNAIRTEMDAGPAKVRRRYTAAARAFSLRYHMTAAQIGTFDTFYVTTSQGQSLAFTWNHPRTNDACEGRFIPGSAQYSSIDHEGDVSVQIEILP